MSSRPGAGEATEEPTPRRLKQARAKGEVPRSGELVALTSFCAGVAALAVGGPLLLGLMASYLRASLRRSLDAVTAPGQVLFEGMSVLGRVTLPVLMAVAVPVLVVSYLQSARNFTLEPIKPKLDRMNPLANLRQAFGAKMLFETAKSLVKLFGIGTVSAHAIFQHLPAILATTLRTPERLLNVVGDCLVSISWRVGLVVGALAALDVLYQRRAYLKRLKMTKEEVKREHKETEGDPQHKAERQRLHRELLEQRMFDRVAEADCVIINPAHVAVAVRYDAQSMAAPIVVARGRGLVAARIRQLARESGVPLIRNVPLARSLVELQLDEEIPGELYQAVAEVLRFVYGLSARAAASGSDDSSRRPPGLRV